MCLLSERRLAMKEKNKLEQRRCCADETDIPL